MLVRLFILLVIILWPIMPYVVKAIFWVICLPFKLLRALFKGIDKGVKRRKEKKKQKAEKKDPETTDE